MKTIIIAGRIGKEAVNRKTQNGDAVTGFTVAVDDRAGKEKVTYWFECSLWGKRGETLSQYLTKGSQVTVSGELGMRTYEGKTQLTVRVNDVALQGVKSDGPKQSQVTQRPQTSYDVDDRRTHAKPTFADELDDGEIPF